MLPEEIKMFPGISFSWARAITGNPPSEYNNDHLPGALYQYKALLPYF
jgi:hypothetical protein